MVEVVIVDLVAMLSILHGKVVARTDKEEITHNISNHLLVEISIIYVLPVSVLAEQFNYLSIIHNITWNMMASFSSCETGHWEPNIESMISKNAARGRKLGLSFLKYSMKS